jgi:hypothetical protein
LTLKESKTKYALEGYRVFFSSKLARQYEPIVYSGECTSGDPEALYYRILQNDDGGDGEKNEFCIQYLPIVYSGVCMSGDPEAVYYRILQKVEKNEYCIQYFYYWKYQNCWPESHNYDYEPIFIYLKSDDSSPYLIVNGGFGTPDCYFHKNEVRPRKGKRDSDIRHVTTNLSPQPFYPFGQDGNLKYDACVKTYPLDTGEDLQFEKGYHALFGIRACSNVFSGAQGDLHGHRFDPPLKKLTDRVLSKWYFHHYQNTNDMPFGHDIADPFSSPYIKFHKPSKEEVERLSKQRR